MSARLWMCIGLAAAIGCTKDEDCGEDYALADDSNCYPKATVVLDADAEQKTVLLSGFG